MLNLKMMDNRRFKDTDNFVQVTQSTITQIRKVHGNIPYFVYRDVSDERNVYIIEPKFLSATPSGVRWDKHASHSSKNMAHETYHRSLVYQDVI